MKYIPLTQNKFALVDDADYDWLNQWKWFAKYDKKTHSFYAIRMSPTKDGNRHQIYMHRIILGLEQKNPQEADHRNHNTLDNKRNNLRICTHRQNSINRRSFRNSSSQFKGVSWDNQYKKWQVDINTNGKKRKLGRFDSEEKAAKAYDKVAIQEFGEFAYLNFPLTIIEKVLQ